MARININYNGARRGPGGDADVRGGPLPPPSSNCRLVGGRVLDAVFRKGVLSGILAPAIATQAPVMLCGVQGQNRPPALGITKSGL